MYANNVSNLDQILSSLQCYTQSSRVRADVYNLLGQIPSLQPNCGTFTHNDGTTSTLLDLEGTIPIFYRSNQYNIPVEFWIVETYPMTPPVCFVRPTPDMMVKPGHPHVTSDGYVKIPYTSDWRQDFTLLELVAHMCSIFGNIPPVFRRPANRMPQYRNSGYNDSSARMSASMGTQQRGSGYYQSGQYSNMSASQPPQYPSSQYASPNNGRLSTGALSPAASSAAGGAGRYSERESEGILFGVAPSPVTRHEDRSIGLKRDITEKLQLQLDKIFTRVRDDTDLQYEHELQLTQSQENVERGIRSLKFLRDDLLRAKANIAAQDEEVSAWLEENEAKDTVDPDLILVEADPLSKQMIHTLAEHHSIEDALYFLDRALSNDEIELSVFLKEVRKLSRKQFMCQALVAKIHEAQQQAAVPAYHT